MMMSLGVIGLVLSIANYVADVSYAFTACCMHVRCVLLIQTQFLQGIYDSYNGCADPIL